MSGGYRTHDRCPMAPRGCGRRSRRPQGVGSSGVKCIPRLAITATLVGAAYHLYRWFASCSGLHALAAGFLSGLALMSKYSAIGFLPALIGSFLFVAIGERLRSRPRWAVEAFRRSILHSFLFLASGMLVVWVCFAWNSSLVGGPISAEYDVLDLVVPSGTVLNQVLSTVVRTMRATVPGFLEGIFNAVNHARGGHDGMDPKSETSREGTMNQGTVRSSFCWEKSGTTRDGGTTFPSR